MLPTSMPGSGMNEATIIPSMIPLMLRPGINDEQCTTVRKNQKTIGSEEPGCTARKVFIYSTGQVRVRKTKNTGNNANQSEIQKREMRKIKLNMSWW